jgi:DNA-binding MarR family transcriptional regulator
MDVKKFRKQIRKLDRELSIRNNDNSCSGVSVAQCHALLEIEQKESLSVNELSEILKLDKSTVSRTIEGLVNIGLVTRTIPAENRRTALLQLTDSGKRTCLNINTINDNYFTEVLSVLDEKEADNLMLMLEIVVNQMETIRISPKKCCNK